MADLHASFANADWPLPADEGRASIGLERWRDAVERSLEPSLRREALAMSEMPAGRAMLSAVFGSSPFLTALAERDPDFAVALFRDGAPAALAATMAAVEATTHAARGGEHPGAALRRAKRRIALTTAVADIAGVWPVEQVTAALADFADAALACAVDWLLVDAAGRGVWTLTDRAEPQAGSGLIVLGMGKLGARELNYSSDIDLIVFYDPECIAGADRASLQHTMVRLVRGLVRLMEERTDEGYVFRTDLRLRPDPASTPVALTVMAAEAYYETLGQNWERAALIKARPVAGDAAAASSFLRQLTPFIWRKNLDFAAIQDVHSIKRQINAHRGGGSIAVAGHNIKLGRGGIREIEFFTQTQQLIWGGRLPALRANATCEALRALVDPGRLLSGAEACSLIAAYRFLRRVEHRLQMINDEQTHVLPTSSQGLAAFARFLGYRDASVFEADLLSQLSAVERHYAQLFEGTPTLGLPGEIAGNLVFTGAEADPDTLRTLSALGFANPHAVDATVRGWHHGRHRAMRSARAREMLTELMPTLLTALADSTDPDASLFQFDQFLSGLPAGVQLFSMFFANPSLLRLVADILGRAPRLAEALARRPALLDAVLSPDFFDPLPPVERLAADVDRAVSQAVDMQDALDIARRWANERRFQVGVQSLRGSLEARGLAAALTAIAEVTIRALLPRVEADFATRHGRIKDHALAIVAMGKLGGREMTATSDLDLIFVYRAPAGDIVSDGARPLPAPQYFARLSQRLINALNAPTSEGILYDVDMRLRPSGHAGPIAVSFDSFVRYHGQEAWTWERMALTRARVIAGPPALASAIETVIRKALTTPVEARSLVVDVAAMRHRMDATHHTDSLWEVKHVRGGLVDIEFIAQYLQLRYAADHPSVLAPNTAEALSLLRDAGVLERETANDLLAALDLWQTIQSRLRLVLKDAPDPQDPNATTILQGAFAGVFEPDLGGLTERMRTTADRVREHFAALIERPAARLTMEDENVGVSPR